MEQTITKRPPYAGVRSFINDYGQYVAAREPITTSALTRYREAQGNECAICHMAISDAARLACSSCAS